MKNKLIIALVVLALAFSMVLTACDDGSAISAKDPDNGKILDFNYLGTRNADGLLVAPNGGTNNPNVPDTRKWQLNKNYTVYDTLFDGYTAAERKDAREKSNVGPKFLLSTDIAKWTLDATSYPYTGRSKELSLNVDSTQRDADYVKANMGPYDF